MRPHSRRGIPFTSGWDSASSDITHETEKVRLDTRIGFCMGHGVQFVAGIGFCITHDTKGTIYYVYWVPYLDISLTKEQGLRFVTGIGFCIWGSHTDARL